MTCRASRPLMIASLLAAISCMDGTERGEFAGVFGFSFEAAWFRPCGSTMLWWIEESGGLAGARGSAIVRGTRSEKGQHGHLGSYQYQLTIEAVLFSSADTLAACTQ